MAFLTRNVKVWIIASLISLIIYDAYILRGSFTILFGYLINVPQDVTYVNIPGAVFWAGFVGLGARFIAVILGLSVAYLIWVKAKPFIKIKNLVALALFLEGINFLALIPSIWFLIRPSFVTSLPLGFGYILQITFALPFLWILALKVIKYHERNQKPALLKYAAFAFIGYIAALAINEVSRWTSMISTDTIKFLLQGIRAVGFLNAVILMPLAVALAVIGAYQLIQLKECLAMKWLGASLSVVGLNYLIYIVYSYYANSLNTLPLVDVWTVPLLGLGLMLMINSRKPHAM
jgi:hypothetical protein